MSSVLFILPQGPTIGGVTTWVCTSANCLARRGHDVHVLVHGHIERHDEITLPVNPLVHLVTEPQLPAPHSLAGRLEPVITRYAAAVAALSSHAPDPVVLVPTRDADCFAACAELVHRQPDRVRVLGWRHSPMPYEREIFHRYAPAMSRMVAVSTYLADQLRSLHPHRGADIECVPNAVAVPARYPSREPFGERPLRLIYTGRLDEPVKRVSALIHTSDALFQAHIDHTLTIIGDGPAHASLAQLAASRPAITLVPALDPRSVQQYLNSSDIFVLPSRIEGLSLSALESMAAGCALAISDTPSGARDLVGIDESGRIAPVDARATPIETGRALAETIAQLTNQDIGAIGRRAHARALAHFSLEHSAERLHEQVTRAAQSHPRTLPAPINAFHEADRPAGVPPHAADQAQRALRRLVGRRIVVFGCGAHARHLAASFDAAPVDIRAFTDDDTSLHGQTFLGRPVVAPDALADTGATDLLLCSWMHEDALWSRRREFEAQGLHVHRIYATVTQPA